MRASIVGKNLNYPHQSFSFQQNKGMIRVDIRCSVGVRVHESSSLVSVESELFEELPSPFHIKVYNAHACSKTKTIGSAQYGPR